MAITFQVEDVPRARTLLPTCPLRTALELLLETPVEAAGAAASNLVAVRHNALVYAAWRAYADHRPLVLGPDAVWLCLAQGFAHHMSLHAEQLRDRFIRHQGRAELLVQRDDFVKGSPANPWPEVLAAFSQQIAGHIGRQRDLVVCDFSTTGLVERAASEIVLMDAMQQYFEYTVLTLCGIPEITLTGTVDDWRSVRRRAQTLAEYGLEWWTVRLLPVLDEFIAAAEGRPDVAFWRSFFKDSDGSGGPHLFGWILLLFPYFSVENELRVNPYIAEARTSPIRPRGGAADWIRQARTAPDNIPLGLSRAPFTWNYLGADLPMDLVGGFVGVAQDFDTLALTPTIGWAVRDRAPAHRVHAASDPAFDRPARGDEIGDADVEALFAPSSTWTAREAPEDGVLLARERVHMGATPGRLLLARDGLYFIPGAAPDGVATDAAPWLGRALTDDDTPVSADSFVAVRGRRPRDQLVVPGSVHLAMSDLGAVSFTTTDLGVATPQADGSTRITYSGPGPWRSLEIDVLLATGEHRVFTVPDPPREPLAAWRALLGDAP